MGLFERPRRTILPTLRAAQNGDRLVGTETELRKAIADARKGESVEISGNSYFYAPYNIVLVAPIRLTQKVVLPGDILGLTIVGRRGAPISVATTGLDMFELQGFWQGLVDIVCFNIGDGGVQGGTFATITDNDLGSSLGARVSGCHVAACDVLAECADTNVYTVIENCEHTISGAGTNSVSFTGTTSYLTIRDCTRLELDISLTGATVRSSIVNCNLDADITISNAASNGNRIVANYVLGDVDTSSSLGQNYIGGNVITGTLSEAATDIVNTGDASGAYNV